MTSRSLTSVLVALLGVYFLGATISQGISTILLIRMDVVDASLQGTYTSQAYSVVLAIAVQGALAVLLVLRRHRIASLLFPADPDTPAPRDSSELQAALFAVLGVFFAVRSSSALAAGFARLGPLNSVGDLWPNHAGSLAEVAFGLLLFFGARGLAGVWRAARTAGLNR